MKKLFAIILLLPSVALAESSSLNLQIPSPGSSYGQDSFRAGELDCKNSVGGSTNLEFGITGIIVNYQSPFSNSSGNSSKDIGVYGRIIIPLDGPKERVNCNTLYQLELKKKRLEIMRLEAELEKLRSLQGEN